MRRSWNEDKALFLLKKYLDEGRWEGVTHFRKKNTPLYEYLYRTMGMHAAFEKLGLNYSDFKKSKGKRVKIRSDEEVTNDLYHFIQSNKWRGASHLNKHHSNFHRELSRLGFPEAFKKIGLDYKDYRHAIWDKNEILKDLEIIINNQEWQGVLQLKIHNNKLYNAIVREFGFPRAFQELGLNYDDYKLYN